MALIENAAPRSDIEDSGYYRLTGDVKIAELFQKVQSTVISAGTELEHYIEKYCKYEVCKVKEITISEENKLSFWIPEGFAHGYSVLSDDAIVLYKCTDVWHQGDEGGVIWNDETLNIDWGVENPIISEKDKNLPKFTDIIK